jgi:hypothetical protein
LRCRNCGDVVGQERVDHGYDYCLKEECQQRCMKRVRLATVGVNKAADYYMAADEVVPPPLPRTFAPIDGDDGPAVWSGRPRPRRDARAKTTLERLRQAEAELDASLRRSYERFCSGELTAREMEREQDQLIRAFNQRVMSENIRYRSLLRNRSNRAG